MKKKGFGYVISISILILLMISAVVIVVPIFNKAISQLEHTRGHYISLFENTTGLSLSYKSLSPSIFSGIRLSDVIVADSQQKEQLIFIDSIKLRWNIFKLFSENPLDALGNLVISGVSIDFNHEHDFDRVMTVLQTLSATQDTSTVQSTESVNPTMQAKEITQLLFSLPIDVHIKNTSLTYEHSNLATKVTLPSIKVSEQKEINHLNVDMDATLSVTPQGIYSSWDDFSLELSFQGSLTPDLENSFAQIRIFSLQDSVYMIERLDLHSIYANNSIQAFALQNDFPFSLALTADFISEDIQIRLETDKLNPFDFMAFSGNNEIVQNLNDSEISGLFTLAYNWNTENVFYTANGNIIVSPTITDENFNINFDIDGNADTITIHAVGVDSSLVTADYTGSLDFENLLPSGVINVQSFTLPSGNILSSQIYMDSSGNDLLLFMPQIAFGDVNLTALQLNLKRNAASVDFDFEVFDYSHAESATVGLLGGNGSFEFGEQAFLQLEIFTESLFIDSVAQIALWCMPEENAQNFETIIPFLESYVCSFDVFVSSDLQTFSYSLPYAVIADTQKDNDFLLLSANGNESLFQLTSFDLLTSGQSVQALASADIGTENSEIFFTASVFFNSIPYTLSGVFTPEEYLNITGDYGLTITANFLEQSGLEIITQADSLPVVINNFMPAFSFDAYFLSNSPQDWFVNLNSFTVTNMLSTEITQSRFSLAGTIDPNGAFFNQVTYSDMLSTLNGIVATSWNINGNIAERFTCNIELSDDFSAERYELNLEVFNPNNLTFNDENFLANTYFSADALIQDLPSSRFADFQNENNTLNASLTAQGILGNPSANLIIDSFSVSAGVSDTEFNANIFLENKIITINDVNMKSQNLNVTNVSGDFSVEDFNGNITGFLDGRLANAMYFAEKTFSSPIELVITSLGDNTNLPFNEKTFTIDLIFKELIGTFFPTMLNYTATLTRTPGYFDLYAGPNGELTGYLSDTGEIEVQATEGFFVLFDAFGIIENNELTMMIDNIFTDARTYSALLNLPVFSLHSGTVTGSGTLTGPLSDLQINADLVGTNMEVSIPDYIREPLVCADFRVSVQENIFLAANSYFVAQESKTGVSLTAELSLEQLTFSYLNLDVSTLNGGFVNAKYDMVHGTFTAQAQADIVLYIDIESLHIEGTVDTKDVEAIITIVPNEALIYENTSDVFVDLTVSLLGQGQLYLPSKNNPIIRGLVNETEPLVVQMNTQYGTSSISGEYSMRGGEIIYLNRTFFVREATAVFDDSMEDFDPRFTASAEIRERDEDGDSIRIILSVVDQPLSQLNPTFTSIPAKSEQEIMVLLGQIISGNTEGANALSLLGGLADYGAQIAIFRNIEGQLRDFFNFDIFSMRTMILQNAFTYALNTTDNDLTIGNFLENTTVYIGKFLGDTLYADAMLTFAYDEDNTDNALQGLVFQPEFGLELPSPFATIRWSIAPDLTTDFLTDWNLLVPYTSISLSWKLNF